MINLTNKQKRYVLTPAILDDTVYIEYYIYWGQPNTPIYSGKCRYFGEFELDLTDWVEWIRSKYNGNGAMTYGGDLIVDIVSIDEDGNERMGPDDRYHIPVLKDDPMIAYEPSVKGLVDMEVPVRTDIDSFGVWIYPVFYLENVYDGRKAMFDTLCLANSYGEHNYDVNLKTFWTSGSDYLPTEAEFTFEIINLLDYFSSLDAYDKHIGGFEPTILFEDGDEDVYSSEEIWYGYQPLAWFWDMEDYDVPSEGKYSYILKQPYSIRYTEEDLVKFYESYVTADIRADYRLTGFAFSVVNIYQQKPVGEGDSPMRIDYHLVGKPVADSDCPYFNLLLVNSDFQGDINVPLVVKNSTLMGKTVNNLDKISFMDRYGDTHNASISNSYELDCYVDPDWLKTSTGNDLGYEAVMAAMQSARKTLLIGTAKISGMRTDGFTMLNCRVKDVEKVETHSRYNGTNRVPSLKITIEIYK